MTEPNGRNSSDIVTLGEQRVQYPLNPLGGDKPYHESHQPPRQNGARECNRLGILEHSMGEFAECRHLDGSEFQADEDTDRCEYCTADEVRDVDGAPGSLAQK